METCHPKELFLVKRTSRTTTDNHLPVEKEATKDHQSTQRVLMFMPTRTRYSTLNRNIKFQVIRWVKMLQQTFHPDLKWEGINTSITLFATDRTMAFMSHTLHKQALAKPVTSKITFLISETLNPIMTLMSQQATDPDLAIESKWKALEWAELLELQLQGMRVSKTLLEWPGNWAKSTFKVTTSWRWREVPAHNTSQDNLQFLQLWVNRRDNPYNTSKMWKEGSKLSMDKRGV